MFDRDGGPTTLGHRHARLSLLRKSNGLPIGESTLSQVRHAPVERTLLPDRWYGNGGAGQQVTSRANSVAMKNEVSSTSEVLDYLFKNLFMHLFTPWFRIPT